MESLPWDLQHLNKKILVFFEMVPFGNALGTDSLPGCDPAQGVSPDNLMVHKGRLVTCQQGVQPLSQLPAFPFGYLQNMVALGNGVRDERGVQDF